MNPEDLKKPEATPEKKEGEVEVTVDLDQIIDALKALDKADQEKIYEALSESLGKPMDGEPKKEESKKEEEPPMNAQDLAKSFM